MSRKWRSRLGVGSSTRYLLASSLAALGFMLWALVIEPRRLVTNQVELDVPRWLPEHGGLKVALLSDLHVGSPHWGVERMRELVERTNAEKPDLVLLAGDYMINEIPLGTWVAPEPVASVLGGLRAPLGVIAVLGNHDWYNDGDTLTAEFREHGIVVLENQVLPIDYRGRHFYVVGLADQLTREQRVKETLDRIPAGAPAIVLVHEPDVFPEIDGRASLTVAGHTHGGQVHVPFLGPPIVPSKFGQRYAAGHVIEHGRHLFVTTGVGTSIYPIRLGVPPEISLLTLR
jgi:predicted MPP superfamily phosphohydrolase